MEIKKIRRVCLVLLCIAVTGIVGCGKKDVNSKKHEPITFMAPYMDVDSFIKEVHKTYPEVNLKVVPYSGASMTRNSRTSVTRCLIFQDMLLRIIM